jgi:hypothetical protein
MDNAHLRDLLWYSGIAIDIVVAGRLAQLRLMGRYPVLFAYQCVATVRGLVLVVLLHGSRRLLGFYGPVYFASQLVVWILYFLLIIELYSRMVEEFSGIRRLGNLVLYSGLGIVAAACSILMLSDHQAGFDYYPLVSYLALQLRSVFLSLSALTLLLLLFVAHYRIRIRRNVWILYAFFGTYFVTSAAMFTMRRYFGAAFDPVRNFVGSLSYLCCLSGIAWFLSKAGEAESRPISVFGSKGSQELDAALSLQLQSFNQVLVKVLKQ